MTLFTVNFSNIVTVYNNIYVIVYVYVINIEYILLYTNRVAWDNAKVSMTIRKIHS